MKSISLFNFLVVMAFMLSSCAAPHYLSRPETYTPMLETKNIFSFGVQNMDEKAKTESNALTCHYDGFDVRYNIREDFVVTFTIVNNTNKSLIIDKSKSYVLYDGYSTQLFKDVRSSRSTTFNNVQDAINNVQTNEAGVSMTIPPYSKWELPLIETNVHAIQRAPQCKYTDGIYPLTPFDDNQEIVEFVIPYTFDYSLANWDTSRNRVFVNSVEVKTRAFSSTGGNYKTGAMEFLPPNKYAVTLYEITGETDYSKANRIDAINWQMYKKHLRKVKASHAILGIITLPTIGGPIFCWLKGCQHQPPRYGNSKTTTFYKDDVINFDEYFGR